MHPGSLALSLMTRFPTLSRPLLALLLRNGAPFPKRAHWVFSAAKRRLTPPHNPRRRVAIARNVFLDIDLRSVVGREIYYHLSYEPTLSRLLARLLAPGDVVVDCGANIGELALRSSRLVGPSGKVVAIEASPATAQELNRNVALNRAANVTVVECALSDRDGEAVFHLGAGECSLSSSFWSPGDFAGQSITVKTRRLASILDELQLERIKLIKLDVEGAELSVIKSMKDRLRSLTPPPYIIFEENSEVTRRAGWSACDIASELEPIGYEVRQIENGSIGSLLESRECSENVPDTKRDLICVPRTASITGSPGA